MKWVSVEKETPNIDKPISFTDGKNIYHGKYVIRDYWGGTFIIYPFLGKYGFELEDVKFWTYIDNYEQEKIDYDLLMAMLKSDQESRDSK